MGYASRKPTSNDKPTKNGKSPWLETNEIADETFLLLNGLAKRCTWCRRAIRIKHLNAQNFCPDCIEETP